MMKHFTVVVGLVALFASGALAQDYIFTTFRFANVTYELPASPCLLAGSVSPVVYQYNAWVFYTCTDGRVFARRFIHPEDSAALTTPQPVMIVQPRGEPPTNAAEVLYDTTDKNWQGTGMTEAEWRRRYPAPSR